MKIERVDIAGFGKLVGVFNMAPGLNVFLGNNETGKSTLQQALLALLYGFYNTSRATPGDAARHEFFRPWNRGPYKATLEYVLKEGTRYRVERDFSTQDVPTKLLELSTGRDVTDQFGRSRHGIVPFAQQHLGLTKEVFLGTAFVTQGEIRLDGDANKVTEALVGLSDTGRPDTSAVTALASLDHKISEIGTERARTQLLQQARRRLDVARDELRSLRASREQLAGFVNRKEELKRELQDAKQELQELSLKTVLVKQTDLETKSLQLDKLDEDIRLQDEQIRNLQPYGTFPENLSADVATKRGELQEAQRQLTQSEELVSGRQQELQELQRSIQELNAKIADLEYARGIPQDVEPEVRALETDWRQARRTETELLAKQQQRRWLLAFGVGLGLVLLLLGWSLTARWLIGVGAALTLGSVAVWFFKGPNRSKASDALQQQLLAKIGQVGVSEAEPERALSIFYERSQKAQQLSLFEGELRISTTRRDNLQEEGRQLDERRQTVNRLEAALRSHYGGAGVTADDLEQAWVSFQESVQKKRAFDRLSGELESNRRERTTLLGSKTRVQLSAEIEGLRAEQEKVLANNPLLVGTVAESALAEYESQQEGLNQSRETLEKQIVSLATQLDERTQGQRDPADVEEDVARWQQEVGFLESSREALEIAKEVIGEAAEEARKDFAPRLNKALAESLSRVTGGRYSRAFVDPATLKVTIEIPETGRIESIDKLSFGTQELISFYLRLSLAQLMSTLQEPIPLVLDDCLVNIDPPRLEHVLDFLAEYSQDYQILLFTQEPEIQEWFSKNCQEIELHRLHTMPS